jgi:hypothetical protein
MHDHQSLIKRSLGTLSARDLIRRRPKIGIGFHLLIQTDLLSNLLLCSSRPGTSSTRVIKPIGDNRLVLRKWMICGEREFEGECEGECECEGGGERGGAMRCELAPRQAN